MIEEDSNEEMEEIDSNEEKEEIVNEENAIDVFVCPISQLLIKEPASTP